MVIYACPQCGSRRIRHGALYVGALTGSKQVCRNCGYQGLPLIFESENDYRAFLHELSDENNAGQIPLTKKDKMVLDYAKETQKAEIDDKKNVEKKPYGLFFVMTITIIYTIFFSLMMILTSFVIFMNPSLQTLYYYYNITLLIASIIAIFIIPYGYLKRKKWAYVISGFIFIYPILNFPIGLFFLYYLTRPHVKAYFHVT